jgi:hypothetical protein
MSPTPVVATARPADSTLRRPTIDVSNSGGAHCQTYHQQPPGGPLSMSPALVVATAGTADSTPQGARHRLFAKLGTCHQNFSSDTYLGSTAVNITATSNQLGKKMRQEFRQKNSGPCSAKNPGIIILL